MPRAYLIVGDIEGKLDVLRVECTKCDRKGRYSVAKLIARSGLETWLRRHRQQASRFALCLWPHRHWIRN